MTAAGAVSDFTPTKVESIASVFAAEANVTTSSVTVTITPGSVVITAKIVLPDAAARDNVAADLTTTLSTPALATSFLAAVPGGVTVSVVAPVAKVTEQAAVVLSPPPSAPSGGDSKDDGMSGGAIAGTVIGAMSGPFFGLVGYAAWKNKQQKEGKYGSGAGVNIQMGQQENV